jgi:hypothetical protein
VFSKRDVTHEIQLALLHLKDRLLVVVGFRGIGVLILLMGLLLLGVRALICIMPWLPTIVANAGQKFLRLGHLLLILSVLEISRGLVLERCHSPLPRRRELRRPMSMFLHKVELLTQSTA